MNISTLSRFLQELDLIIPVPPLREEEASTLKFVLLFMTRHFNQQVAHTGRSASGIHSDGLQWLFHLEQCSRVNPCYFQCGIKLQMHFY